MSTKVNQDINTPVEKEITLGGIAYILKGVIKGTAEITIVPKEGQPQPNPKPDPAKPDSFGTIKDGAKWSKNPGKPETWKIVPMKDTPNKFKIIDTAGLNVIADLDSELEAKSLIEYFKVNPFPPKDTTNPPPPPPDPNPNPNPNPNPTPGVDTVEGIKLPYKTTGKTRKDPFWNKRDDGLRLDFKGAKGADYVNSIMVFYGTFKDDVPDDDITFKWSWDSHSGNAVVKAYGIGLNNKNGNLRGRMEWTHPDYTSNLANGKGGKPITKGKTFGYMGVKKTLANGNVLLEYYQDQGGLDANGKPSNQWVKLLTWEDSKYKVTDYSENGCTGTIRIDDESKGWENVDVKLAYFIEIQQ